MSSVGRSQSVKVVIINTKYVETDAMSFKDVVQRLTGKDSRVAYEVQEPVTKSPKYFLKEEINGRTSNNVMESSNTSTTSTMSRDNSSVLMRNISFKEFERMFREMPPVEEFWAE
ncbi:VQ motif-containing protein 1-like [Pyrus x bretschneideri]|uniref:VQ motif-containing protein 1-like n=1 Tax=Pyrus x bretschneideri TaxID=225117 RepID=UPI000510EEEA|nr:VQ motif-containing protein 1-like [Pyrus x bretschneideri]